MAMPDYQRIMLPLLRCLADRTERHNSELVGLLAKEFRLSDEERKQVLARGRETAFGNRVRWARFYLLKAGLLEARKRGVASITPAGLELLGTKPKRLDQKSLLQYPGFGEYIGTLAKSRRRVEAESVVASKQRS